MTVWFWKTYCFPLFLILSKRTKEKASAQTRRCQSQDNDPVIDESATISAFCRKLPQVCQVCGKIPDCQSNRLKSLFTCTYYTDCWQQCQQSVLCPLEYDSYVPFLFYTIVKLNVQCTFPFRINYIRNFFLFGFPFFEKWYIIGSNHYQGAIYENSL